MPKKVPKAVSQTQKMISEICGKALEQIQSQVLSHFQKHPDSAWTGHNLVDLEKTVKAAYKDMGLSIGKTFSKGLSKEMKEMHAKAAEDLKTAGLRNAILGKPNTGLIKQYMDSSFEQVAMRTTKMSFDHIRALRSMSADVLRTASLTGASRAEVTRQFLARAQEIPGFKFTANNGAVWSNEAYFNMLARTEMMNAGRAAYDAKCAEEGCDVVELDYGGVSCETCMKWEGKQFSLTGATKGLPTKQDLIDDGVFHPNCTHSYTAVPDWDIKFPDKDEKGAKEQDAKQDAKQDAEQEQQARQAAAQPAPFPTDPGKLRFVENLGGSTGAELVEDAQGNRFVRKTGNSPEHLRNECAVDEFYRASGVNVPECKLYETKKGPVKLSRYLGDTESLDKWWRKASKEEREAMKEKLRKGFDVDVISGNWDVVGMNRDNILIKDGEPWRIDNGGAFGFRAQGAQKKPEEWKAGWPDDLWSMRTSAYNKELFGGVDTLDLCNSISKRDWSKALEKIPEEERKVVEKRLAEVKQLADRGNDFKDNTKYKPESIETILKASYDYSKAGLREKVPHEIKAEPHSNTPNERDGFGWFRSTSLSPTAQANKDFNQYVQKAFTEAADELKKPNPDKTKLRDAYGAEDILKKEAQNGSAGAKYYLEQLERFREAEKTGKPLKGDVYGGVYVKTNTDPEQHNSFISYINDTIGRQSVKYNGQDIPLDPNFIRKAQADQAGNSFAHDSCKMKMVRLNAQGIKPDDADQSYFTGISDYQTKNWADAKKYYEDHPDELARDTETYLRYQSAVQIALENTNFEGKDPATRSILLGRTEDDNVMANSKVGHEMQAKHGVNESHGIFQTVVVEGSNLTVTRVPYSRISGIYFAERKPGTNRAGFCGNDENEFTADTSGLKTMYVKEHVGSGENMKPYRETYIKWEKDGYP